MTATKIEKREGKRTGREARPEPPWNVILHNDWENSMPKVVWVLVTVVPGMTIKRATRIMWEAHTKGRAVVKRCHKELRTLRGALAKKGANREHRAGPLGRGCYFGALLFASSWSLLQSNQHWLHDDAARQPSGMKSMPSPSPSKSWPFLVLYNT
jgi:ATP-dependent Clp protease adapter protein ClpS